MLRLETEVHSGTQAILQPPRQPLWQPPGGVGSPVEGSPIHPMEDHPQPERPRGPNTYIVDT